MLLLQLMNIIITPSSQFSAGFLVLVDILPGCIPCYRGVSLPRKWMWLVFSIQSRGSLRYGNVGMGRQYKSIW